MVKCSTTLCPGCIGTKMVKLGKNYISAFKSITYATAVGSSVLAIASKTAIIPKGSGVL